jgi:hypothetical protein
MALIPDHHKVPGKTDGGSRELGLEHDRADSAMSGLRVTSQTEDCAMIDVGYAVELQKLLIYSRKLNFQTCLCCGNFIRSRWTLQSHD